MRRPTISPIAVPDIPPSKPIYRIVLACNGVTADVGAVAARDITEEFTHRPWHHNVHCERDGSRLILQADNDFAGFHQQHVGASEASEKHFGRYDG